MFSVRRDHVADGRSLSFTIYEMVIKKFIEEYGEMYNKQQTFAICSYVPPWYDDNIKIVKENFTNVFTYYPG